MLTVIGTIKINSPERERYFLNAIESLAPVGDMFSWKLNIVGKYATIAQHEIEIRFPDVCITCDGTLDTYSIQRAQMDAMDIRGPVITWQEDHLFICPHQNLFRYLYHNFYYLDAEILTITHLMTSWQRKVLLSCTWDKHLYKIYSVNPMTQYTLWEKYPNAYLTGSPAIYKWQLASDILEFKKDHMTRTTLPGFELDAGQGRLFLSERTFTEMVPTFHVFREIAQETHSKEARQRAIPEHEALSWIRLRNKTSSCGGER